MDVYTNNTVNLGTHSGKKEARRPRVRLSNPRPGMASFHSTPFQLQLQNLKLRIHGIYAALHRTRTIIQQIHIQRYTTPCLFVQRNHHPIFERSKRLAQSCFSPIIRLRSNPTSPRVVPSRTKIACPAPSYNSRNIPPATSSTPPFSPPSRPSAAAALPGPSSAPLFHFRPPEACS